MLGLVVMNERRDLEDAYAENSKEAFDSIKSLKDIESALLAQFEASFPKPPALAVWSA